MGSAAAVPEISTQLPPDWRARLRARLLRAPDHRLEHSRFGGIDHATLAAMRERLHAVLPPVLQPAAVLVPIIEHPHAPRLLLTERAGHLRRHAGQISFPGGRLEPGDADIAAAALRETEEETGIRAAFVETLGFLSDHVVQTGYRITPVVALLQPGFTLRVDAAEVAEVFELPLAFALEAGNYRSQRRVLRALEVDAWNLPYAGRDIWGATAGMLVHLRELVCAPTWPETP